MPPLDAVIVVALLLASASVNGIDAQNPVGGYHKFIRDRDSCHQLSETSDIDRSLEIPPDWEVPEYHPPFTTTSRPHWDQPETSTPSSSDNSNTTQKPSTCTYSSECGDMICNNAKIEAIPTEEIPANLSMFQVSQTQLHVLDYGVFQGKSIEAIIIQDNPLDQITEGAFDGVSGLRYLMIKGNDLKVAEYQLANFFSPFRGLDDLEALVLDHNLLDLTGVGIEMSDYNKILPSVLYLSLRSNPLRRIERNFFTPLFDSPLQSLDLQSGSLESIHSEAFKPLAQLRAINLYNNYKLFQTSGVNSTFPHFTLSPLQRLSTVNFGANLLTSVPWNHLRVINGSLLHLTLTGNVFIELGMSTLEHNAEDTFPYLPRLKTLILDACRIQVIQRSVFENLPKLETLSLKQNPLYTIPTAAVIPSLRALYFEGFEEMFRDGDKFYFDGPIFQRNGLKSNLETLSITHSSMELITPESLRGLEKLSKLVLDFSIFEGIANGAFSSLKNLEKLSLYSALGLNEVPVTLLTGPKNLTVLDLTFIPISSGNYQSAVAEKAASQCEDDYPLDTIQVLNLTGSLINLADPMGYLALESMPQLRVLNISQNRIISWKSPVFQSNPHMQVLQVTENHDIINLTKSMLDDIAPLREIDFRNSVFECNENVARFLQMSERPNSSLIIRGFSLGYGYFCRRSDGTKVSFRDYAEQGFDLDDGIQAGEIQNYTALISSLLASIAAMTVLVLLANTAYKNRWYFEYQWAKRNVQRQRLKEDSNPFQYDTFISYNGEDKDLVHDFVLPALENDVPNVRVCVHERDFVVGKSIIENIVSSLESSRTCIIVLSKDYAKSEWCCFEAQMALRMFQEDERTSKMIVVIVRNRIPGAHLNKTLKTIIKLRTYLEWNDPEEGSTPSKRTLDTFFKRLRFSLDCLNPNEESISITDTDLLSFF